MHVRHVMLIAAIYGRIATITKNQNIAGTNSQHTSHDSVKEIDNLMVL